MGLGPLVPQAVTSTVEISLLIFNCPPWVWELLILHLHPFYQSSHGFSFIALVLISVQLVLRFFSMMAVL